MNTKTILTLGALVLSLSLFASAQNAISSDQIDLTSTPCQCLQYNGVNTSGQVSAIPESMAAPMGTQLNLTDGDKVSQEAAPRVFPLTSEAAYSAIVSVR